MLVSTSIFTVIFLSLYQYLASPSEKRLNRIRLKRLFSRPLVWFFAVLLIWLIWFPLMPAVFKSDFGPKGDMFGSLTSLFSGLAFSGLIWTLVLQRKELTLQRDELSQTREVFERQAFETTYFNLISSFEDYLDSIEVTYRRADHKEERAKGRSALRAIANECSELSPGTRAYAKDPKIKEMEITENYERALREHEVELTPYFRTLFSIFRHVRESNLSDEEKFNFGKIIRARLSSPEVFLIALNALSSNKNGYTYSVSEFGLLRHLPDRWAKHLPSLHDSFGADAWRE